MSNKEKYDNAFCEVMRVKPEELEDLAFRSVPAWDSIGHMQLMTEMEETFNISIKSDDVLKFASYKEGIVLLRDEYDVEF